ncbi:MAG: hypothetical protein A3A81_07900 [Omnitrophica bacterium RIFCSPLOWO2_01_FULL_45_10b]|nr:MAG: hypothetical protein A3A81_07900 [Omnitrophica bacterium RIFCSPLOWO2_01_FULL_45_10b]
MPHQVAAVSEIFSSLQGEGTHMGERHMFLRFEACNIHCEYCDELGKPGYDFDLDATLESLKRLDKEFGPHSYVSLTGGEPLLYVSFLKDLLPKLKEMRWRTYLETNGILWQALEQVISWTDLVAMDVKPASVTKERSFLKEHEAFLKIAVRKETFIKMVCSKEIDLGEFKELCEMIQNVITRHCPTGAIPILWNKINKWDCEDPKEIPRPSLRAPQSGAKQSLGLGTGSAISELGIASASTGTLPRNDGIRIPLILQPMSGEIEGHEDPELMRLLGELQTVGLGILQDVRIVPRLHKILKIR